MEVKQILPRDYATVCRDKPEAYSDYGQYKVQWGNPEDYSVVQQIGKGGYSEVYECIKETEDNEEHKHCIIKILKPTNELSVLREIKILNELKNGPSIVKLVDALQDDEDETPCLVFEKNSMVDLHEVMGELSPEDIKYFLYKILSGIHYAHSKGIMHRDIKMQNVLVDITGKDLRIIDWGLSEYYHAGFAYNLKVSTKFYRAPELILGYPYYDYSLDIWCIGILFAELMIKKFPLINCMDSKDQLNKQVRILGYKAYKDCLTKYNVKNQFEIKENLKKQDAIDFRTLFPEDRLEYADPDALDLLSKLLCFDKDERLTAKEALEHHYFDSVAHVDDQTV